MNQFTLALETILTADHTKPMDWVTRFTYAGRAGLGSLSNGLLCRIELVTSGVQDQYDSIRVRILSRACGEIDQMSIRFSDLWRPQMARSGRICCKSLKLGAEPSTNALKWYPEKPEPYELEALRGEIVAYATLFA